MPSVLGRDQPRNSWRTLSRYPKLHSRSSRSEFEYQLGLLLNPITVSVTRRKLIITMTDANNVTMTDAQLQRLLTRLTGAAAAVGPVPAPRGFRRLTIFTSAEGAEWRVWRRNFVTIIAINEWADLRARRELASAMEGAASRAVSDLDVTTFANVTLTLDAYEERFIPRAAAQLARAEFDRARQASNETVLQWHTRLREIFSRAYPERVATNDRPLIDKFTIGLVDSALARHMLDHQPASFSQALQTAQSKQATEDLMAARFPNQAPSISAMNHQGGRPAGTSGCWYCQEPGHNRSDCSKFLQQKEIFAKYFKIEGNTGNSNRGFRGGRGRGRGGRGRGGPPRSNNYMEPTAENTEN